MSAVFSEGRWCFTRGEEDRWVAYDQHASGAFQMTEASKLMLEALCAHPEVAAAHAAYCRAAHSSVGLAAFAERATTLQATLSEKRKSLRGSLPIRMTVVPAKTVNVVANALRPLINTKLLIIHAVLLPVAAFVLFGGMGALGSMSEVGYGGFLVTAAVLASAMFHEFGHAAAIRRAGHRVGSIGAGVFWVLPVFFTEIPGHGAIARRDRAWVNGGGIHFQLLFCHAFLIAACVFRTPLAVACCAVLYCTTAFQLIPIAQSDGYWLVMDLLSGYKRLCAFASAAISGIFFMWLIKATMMPVVVPWLRGVVMAGSLSAAARTVWTTESLGPLMSIVILLFGAKALVAAIFDWIGKLEAGKGGTNAPLSNG